MSQQMTRTQTFYTWYLVLLFLFAVTAYYNFDASPFVIEERENKENSIINQYL